MLSSKKGVELKGGMYTFMSLKLHTPDMEIIDHQLAEKVQQAPAFFKDTPVVIDLSVLEQLEGPDIDTNSLIDCVKRHKLLPIVASIGDKSSPLAQAITLPLVESGSRRQVASAQTGEDSAKDQDSTPQPSEISAHQAGNENTDADLDLTVSREIEYVVKAPTLVNKPVRSGQQIYARDTDLIVMGQVGPGAEVIADNNIHIYGPLRGRALCGVSGNSNTRIFCQSLEAELVSVAGNFRMLETIPEELRGKPAQIWLDNDRLNIEPL